LRPYLAEGLGTFLLVLIGCGAIAVDARTGQLGVVGVALAFGLVVGVMVVTTGHVSGAHLNPAVSVAMAASGRIGWRRAAGYASVQVTAAVIAAAVLRGAFGPDADIGVTRLSVPPVQALLWESVLTMVLVLVILAVVTEGRGPAHLAPLAIGGAVTLGALVAGPMTGGSLNPARSIGPALVSGEVADLWVHIVGPMAGALAAVLADRVIAPASAAWSPG
jgi:MIP family channel proteins